MAARWVALLQNDAITSGDLERFRVWQNADPRNAAAYRHIAGTWSHVETDSALAAERLRAHFSDELKEMSTSRAMNAAPRRFFSRSAQFGGTLGLAGAAAVLVIVAVSMWVFIPSTNKNVFYETSFGEVAEHILEDGSRIILAPQSKVVFAFSDEQRTGVVTRGQVYFDIESDPARPFSVSLNDAKLSVVGTAFAVSLGKTEGSVTVVEGRVAFTLAETEVLLEANERLRFSDVIMVRDRNVDTDRLLSWTQGKWTYLETPLVDVARDVAEFHGLTFEFANEDISALPLTGIYRTDNPQAVLDGISVQLPVLIERDGMIITLAPSRH